MEAVERTVNGARVVVLGSVRGLVKEAAEVRERFEGLRPEAVALSIGGRELDEVRETLKEKGDLPGAPGNRAKPASARHGPSGLPDEKLEGPPGEGDFEDFGLFVSTSDLIFLRHLSKWGEVEMPPPSYQEAVRLAHAGGTPVEAVDFDDDAYTDLFLDEVSAFALVRQGRRLRKLARRKFASTEPAGFAREWDGLLTKVKGYGAVERAREEKVAAGILAAARGRERLLAIVEAERFDGVVAALARLRQAGGADGGAKP